MSEVCRVCQVCGKPAERNVTINNGDDAFTSYFCQVHYDAYRDEVFREIDQRSGIHHSDEQ